MARATNTKKAERLNLARTVLREHRYMPDAVDALTRACSISRRQAYRYLEVAQQLRHPVPVGDAKVSFTVKMSQNLVDRIRGYAASNGLTLSEIVSRALQALLHRGGGRGQ
jgi:predicted DNA-binding transcriptional regulator YafY